MKEKSVGNGIFIKGKWEFNQNVAEKFDEHIQKSLPFYDIGHEIILDNIEIFLENNSQKNNIIITDIGCSTGILIQKISNKFKNYPLTIYGIDKEKSMIEIAKKRSYSTLHNINWICESIENYSINKSDIIICYYLLQFIPVRERLKILQTIYKNLNKKGIFFLFEKVKSKNKIIDKIYQTLIIKYKLKHGYILEEIKNKEKSLKGILIPLTVKDNFRLIDKAGFKNYDTILQYASFIGILAKK